MVNFLSPLKIGQLFLPIPFYFVFERLRAWSCWKRVYLRERLSFSSYYTRSVLFPNRLSDKMSNLRPPGRPHHLPLGKHRFCDTFCGPKTHLFVEKIRLQSDIWDLFCVAFCLRRFFCYQKSPSFWYLESCFTSDSVSLDFFLALFSLKMLHILSFFDIS